MCFKVPLNAVIFPIALLKNILSKDIEYSVFIFIYTISGFTNLKPGAF